MGSFSAPGAVAGACPCRCPQKASASHQRRRPEASSGPACGAARARSRARSLSEETVAPSVARSLCPAERERGDRAGEMTSASEGRKPQPGALSPLSGRQSSSHVTRPGNTPSSEAQGGWASLGWPTRERVSCTCREAADPSPFSQMRPTRELKDGGSRHSVSGGVWIGSL